MSFPNDRTYAFDANLLFSDGLAALTASGFTQAFGANGILDLGGNQGANPKQQARIDACAVIDISAIKISSGNEVYKILILASNDPALATGNVMVGGAEVGKGVSLDGINMADSVVGRLEIPFCTQVAGVLYEYFGVYVVISGTTPSITFQGFVAVLQEP